MRINKLIAKSRTTEVDTVTKQITTSFENSTVKEDANLITIFAEITPLANELTTAIHSLKAESSLEERDIVRDDAVRAVYYMSSGFVHHPSSKIKESAKAVLAVFDHYGLEMISESYAVESSLINSLLEQFAEPKLAEQITKLPGVAQLVESLATAQTEFESASLEYSHDKATEITQRSASKIKKEVVSLINNKVVVYLRAMVVVNTVQYEEFAGTVAKIIHDNNREVKKRSK